MLNRKKSSLSLAIILVFNIIASTSVSAAYKKHSICSESMISQTKEYVQNELSINDNYTVAQTLPLYNTSEEIIAVLCQLEPTGYAVYDPLYNQIIEFSFQSDRNLFSGANDHYYYLGVTQFYTKESQSQYQLNQSQEIISIPDNVSFTTADLYYNEPQPIRTLADLPGSGATISHSTRLYNCNISDNYRYLNVALDSKGVCGSVACSIVAAYFDDYIDDNYCDNIKKRSGNSSSQTYGIDLVRDMVAAVEPLSGDATLLWGMNDYLESRGVSETIHLDAFSGILGMAKKQVKKDEPYIVGAAKMLGSTYGDHWMVGIGWFTTLGGDYIVVNDGQGKDMVHVAVGTIATNWYIE